MSEDSNVVTFEFNGEISDLRSFLKSKKLEISSVFTTGNTFNHKIQIAFVNKEHAFRSLLYDGTMIAGKKIKVAQESFKTFSSFDPEEFENVKKAIIGIIQKYAKDIPSNLFDELVMKLYVYNKSLLEKKPSEKNENSFFGRPRY